MKCCVAQYIWPLATNGGLCSHPRDVESVIHLNRKVSCHIYHWIPLLRKTLSETNEVNEFVMIIAFMFVSVYYLCNACV